MTDKREMPNYYSIMPADVRYDKRLKANEKIIYSEITALSNKYGYCTAGNAYFAELYESSKATVSRWISHLEDCGYIKVKIVYEEDGKTIKQRRIYLANAYVEEEETNPIDNKNNRSDEEVKVEPTHKNINTLLTETSRGYVQKSQYPIDEKVKDNNTSNNITSMNNTRLNSSSIYTNTSLYTSLSDKDKSVINYYCQFVRNNSSVDDLDLVIKALGKHGWEKVLYTLAIIKDERKHKVSSFNYVNQMLRDADSYDDFVVGYVANRELRALKGA